MFNTQDLEYLAKIMQGRSVADLQGRVVYDKIVEMHKKLIEDENEKDNITPISS